MGIFDFFRKKERGAGPAKKRSESEDDHITRHCFVLSRADETVDLWRANSVVADVFGSEYSADVSSGNVVGVLHGEESVGFLALMPAPIPDGEAERYAESNFLWPHGKEESAEHSSHVIVTNMGGQKVNAIQSAITVSKLALVALDLFDGIGVYWGNASVCNSRMAFESFCEGISEEHLPVPMWLRFQLIRASNESLGLYTLGMQQFGLMNIEVDRCPMDVQELFEFVANVADYLIKSGPVIADGNTVGGDAEERIRVRHLPSMIDEDRQVYKMIFDGG